MIAYAERHSKALRELAKKEKNPKRRKELARMAKICAYVPAHAPRDFWEALQYYWFVHIGVISELNPWDAFNPGRLDQHLHHFYENGLKEGTLTEEQAEEFLQAFWIKFNNQPAPPKVGVTAEESNTYTDFALINTGGVKADGSDAVNELSYLILDVVEEMRLTQPSSMVQISKKTPDRFLKKAFKILEITLNNGLDPRTGKKIGLETGDPSKFRTFDELLGAFKKQLLHFVNIKIEGNNIIEKLYSERLPVPFLSLFIDNCIAKGKDYNDGGAKYNTNYIQGVGLGTITDSLTAIKL